MKYLGGGRGMERRYKMFTWPLSQLVNFNGGANHCCHPLPGVLLGEPEDVLTPVSEVSLLLPAHYYHWGVNSACSKCQRL